MIPPDSAIFTTSLLHKASDPYRLLVDSVRDYAIYLLDTAGYIISWNTAAERIKGFTAEEALGQHFDMMFAPELAAAGRPRQDLATALAEGHFEDEGLRTRKDGATFWGIYAISPLYEANRHLGFAVVVRDVSERKQHELALRRAEQRYRSLTAAMAVVVWAARPDGAVKQDMTGWTEFSGMSEEATVGWGWLEAVHPDDRDAAAASWNDAIEQQQNYVSRYRMQRSDGEWRHIVARAAPVKDEQGGVLEWIGVCEDVTEAEEAQLALEASEKRHRALVEYSWDGIILLDKECRFLDITPAGERILGVSKDAIVGKPAVDFVFPGEVHLAEAALQRYVENPGERFHTQRQMQPKDGPPRTLEFSGVNLLHDPVIGAIVSNFRDITEQKQLEQQYLQAQKMEAVGQLAGGVAHDFNNVLTVITSYCELLEDRTDLDRQTRAFLGEISNAAQRAGTLTRQLLAFSRQDVTENRILDLNSVVACAEAMIRRLIGEDVELRLSLADGIGMVSADKGHIEQTLLNLAVNARDAMPQGGRLSIATANVHSSQAAQDATPPLAEGEYVALRVADNGCGMDAETRARIYEPFFTTKASGKGTGLGLATVHGVVAESGGSIALDSAVGAGTTFTIYLPRAEEAAAPPEVAADGAPPARGVETILIVEDEPAVRDITHRILAGGGYSVLEACDGREALEILSAHLGPIDLVVSDVVMPHLGGKRLADQAAEVRPDSKFLFISGYANDAVFRHGVREHQFAFLSKPFRSFDLLHKVRQVLDTTDAAN